MKKILISLFLLININLFSQENCENLKENGGGFNTVIESVIDSCDFYLIQMRVEHNGCGGPNCKELSHYSIEAIPNTYYDIVVTIVNGDIVYGNVDLGPNLGQDGINGFKIDNISNIGGGKSGVFTVEYKLTELQNQIFIAKAGNNLQSVSFLKSEFETVRDCNNTICLTDNIENFFPSNGFGTLAFEDLWPNKGDYDFNDLVIDYQFKINTDINNFIQSVDGTFIIKAFGASFENGFGFQLAENINQTDIFVTGYKLTENIININLNGLEENQNKPTIIVFDNTFNLMAHPGVGVGVNTELNAPYVTPDTIRVNIQFNNNNYTIQDLNISEFNPFIFVNKNRNIEVHLPDYPPTNLADINFLGTFDDDSDFLLGEFYKTANNLPWAINIYETFNYPIEKIEVTRAHLMFFDWAESNGLLFPDWYKNNQDYRNENLIYK